MKKLSVMLFLGSAIVFQNPSFGAPAKQIIVGPDDTVYGVAYNNGIPTRALISANNLKPPYTLKNGQVLVIPAPHEHIVGDGETLESIAENYGLKVDVLAQENSISSPSAVTPGTHLTLPSRDTESMVEALKPPSEEISMSSLAPLPLIKSEPMPAKSPAPLAAITSPPVNAPLPDDLAEELAREKGNEASKAGGGDQKKQASSKKPEADSLKPMLMGNLAQGNAGAPLGAPSDSSAEDAPEEKKAVKEEKKKEKAPQKKETKKKDKKVDKEPTEDTQLSFAWPVEGEVISKFSGGGKNDGINIKVPEGTAVKASADGIIMYAGNELKDFGNLVLIKHKEGWVTAYAHNSALLVKKGDAVKQGQSIANSGKVGDVGEPQLHFEIRKVKQPIDPLTKLRS